MIMLDDYVHGLLLRVLWDVECVVVQMGQEVSVQVGVLNGGGGGRGGGGGYGGSLVGSEGGGQIDNCSQQRGGWRKGLDGGRVGGDERWKREGVRVVFPRGGGQQVWRVGYKRLKTSKTSHLSKISHPSIKQTKKSETAIWNLCRFGSNRNSTAQKRAQTKSNARKISNDLLSQPTLSKKQFFE